MKILLPALKALGLRSRPPEVKALDHYTPISIKRNTRQQPTARRLIVIPVPDKRCSGYLSCSMDVSSAKWTSPTADFSFLLFRFPKQLTMIAGDDRLLPRAVRLALTALSVSQRAALIQRATNSWAIWL
jgi:hypothetical protein